ncbi:3-hydroxy-3-methylglutaryl coenzyme a synthase [Anaeramoeba flamelloides]|uniref:Hydroxymethylglutaryl-CoA synthase n=1 Tax=Anaeramoeba flamelloides TaxID=1746091 RepID=A0AAV7ZW21_9EUKA|nr:3-hydroxy-3-methylglutaryl coenzyme a synthase [Anaeramoeba flamelloides]
MDFGIIDIELYFPKVYVSQSELEEYDNVSKGKYTIGLLQTNMSFPLENEDTVSLALNAFDRLVTRSNIDLNSVGRLEVGTESSVDKSKSIKTHLMKFFEKSGNNDVLGVDNVNACYGATAALLNCINWFHSPFYDGGYAIVVSSDIAIYEKGPARPTGGCGAIAMLIGPDAPIVFEKGHGYLSSFFSHDWDFYKPKMSSSFPIVDGRLSIGCYLEAIDNCYDTFRKKYTNVNRNKKKERLTKKSKNKKENENGNENQNQNENENDNQNEKENKSKSKNKNKDYKFDLNRADHVLFHSPFNKMVVKSWARLNYLDWYDSNLSLEGIQEELRKKPKSQTRTDRSVETSFRKVSNQTYKEKIEKSNYVCAQCGNLYTGALYGALISLILDQKEKITGKNILMFSYGSGIASSMFLLKVRKCPTKIIKACSKIPERLESRTKINPEMYTEILKNRENDKLKQLPYNPEWKKKHMWGNSWYLKQIDEKCRRLYEKSNAFN